MGLVSGLVMGAVVGVALMAGWSYMTQRRSRKRIAKAADIKLLGALSRDDLRKICGDYYPEWISFPAFEQVKWLNKHLSKLWPYIAGAAEVLVKESVEPLLDDYRPAGITSLKFRKFSLGNVAPKIEGIRVQSFQPGQITMDIDFRWGGDPSIIIEAGTALVATLPIQLKDLQVFTVARVIFQLSEEIPCISAVAVALLADPKPRIEYTLKAVGGSLTAIPGINEMIDDTVTSIVTDMLQWPHRHIVPLGVNTDTSELELKLQGCLKVTVVKASSLLNIELLGKSDPYVVLHIRPMLKFKTKVVDDNLDPVWNETFFLNVEDKETQCVTFEIFDEDQIKPDKKMGIVQLALKNLAPEVEKEVTLKILSSLDTLHVKDKKDKGTLTVMVSYHEFTKEEQEKAQEEEKRAIEEKKRLKRAGLMGSTMDAVGGAASLVGSGVGLVGTGLVSGVGLVGSGVGAGVGLVGTGIGTVGSGIGTGVGLVGTGLETSVSFVGRGLGAGVGAVESGIGSVGSGLGKMGKLMGIGSRKSAASAVSPKGSPKDSSDAGAQPLPPPPQP